MHAWFVFYYKSKNALFFVLYPTNKISDLVPFVLEKNGYTFPVYIVTYLPTLFYGNF
jgi:hypothetical protein